MQLEAPTRIIVLARPDLARQVDTILRGSGHEVFRTPDAAGLASLVARVRPHLVIIAGDMPWADASESPRRLASRLPEVPVLLIDDINDDGHADGIPHLSWPIDHVTLQASVAKLLTSSMETHID